MPDSKFNFLRTLLKVTFPYSSFPPSLSLEPRVFRFLLTLPRFHRRISSSCVMGSQFLLAFCYIYMIIEMETENSFLRLIRLNNKRRRFPPPERTYLVTVTLQFNRSPDVGSRIMSSRDGSNLFPISENQVVRRPMCVKPCLMPHYT